MIRRLSKIMFFSLALGLFGLAPRARAAEPRLIPLKADGKVVATYMAEPNPMKPYVKELFTPSGVQVMLDSPPDHVHHHGLMFAVGAGETDFWSEKPAEKFGKQVPRAGKAEDPDRGVRQILDWVAPGGKTLLVERRTINMVDSGKDGPNLLSWTMELTPAEGTEPVKLWGRHYFGLGLRLIPDLNGKEVHFTMPAGTPPGHLVRGDEHVTTATWCAASGKVGGKPVTVAMWDHPSNERRVAWFTMTQPFSYFGATLDLERSPMELAPGKKLRLRYGVAVFDGTATPEEIEKTRQVWLKFKEPYLYDAVE